MKKVFSTLILTAAFLVPAVASQADQPAGSAKISIPLDTLVMPNQTVSHFDIGIGSGACRLSTDPEGVFYTITDRGPNIKTTDADKLVGEGFADKKGKIFPVPNFSPSIFKMKITGDQVEILEKIQLKTADGTPVSGISNPDTEAAWDTNGKALDYDPAGFDAEGIAALKDGSFWIGEEYAPSIAHIAADGRVIERWVPEGVAKTLEGAGYPIKENLPAIIRTRALNRGIESMAVSPDESSLYFAMQSPLANPDKGTYKKGRNLRIFKIDRAAGKVVGEYVYVIDTADTFGADNAKKARKQNDVKVSELTAVGKDKLVVLERISKTTKFYLIDLASGDNILGSKWDAAATSPSLEASAESPVKAVAKKLVMDSDEQGDLMSKVEGMAWFGGDQWVMVNDNDFGIAGDCSYAVPVTMPVK